MKHLGAANRLYRLIRRQPVANAARAGGGASIRRGGRGLCRVALQLVLLAGASVLFAPHAAGQGAAWIQVLTNQDGSDPANRELPYGEDWAQGFVTETTRPAIPWSG